jgi:hypothetical protein
MRLRERSARRAFALTICTKGQNVFWRINVRPDFLAVDAGRALNDQNILGRNSALRPPRHGSFVDAKHSREIDKAKPFFSE